MFRKLSILRAPKRVLQAALVCESDSLPLASQKAADSFSSCCSFFEATEPAFEASEAAHAQHCFRLKGFIVPLNRSAVWLAFCILIHFDFSVRLHLPQEVISTVLSTLVAVAVKSFRLWDHGPRNHEQVRRKYSGI